ncbi:MAG: methionine biosynthesis protein MetW [Spirochaetia bacterium]|nr:methionine biosynthesis protein MetW [Spirochaetia bacterium]
MYKEIYLRHSYEEIVKMITENSRVMDLGCGDGELLAQLIGRKQVYGLGVDINTEEILKCIKKGVSVIQEDINEGLYKYKDKSFDYVILSETLQAVRRPDHVLNQMVRIGKQAVVTFPNFAYGPIRTKFLLTGMMPKSDVLPFDWYSTPNIHLLTIKDFKKFCRDTNIKILKEVYFQGKGNRINAGLGFENWLAEEAVFLIQKEAEQKITVKEVSVAKK